MKLVSVRIHQDVPFSKEIAIYLSLQLPEEVVDRKEFQRSLSVELEKFGSVEAQLVDFENQELPEYETECHILVSPKKVLH